MQIICVLYRHLPKQVVELHGILLQVITREHLPQLPLLPRQPELRLQLHPVLQIYQTQWLFFLEANYKRRFIK